MPIGRGQATSACARILFPASTRQGPTAPQKGYLTSSFGLPRIFIPPRTRGLVVGLDLGQCFSNDLQDFSVDAGTVPKLGHDIFLSRKFRRCAPW